MKEPEKKKVMIPYPRGDFASTLTDPQGSYTGVPYIILDAPVQDADDL